VVVVVVAVAVAAAAVVVVAAVVVAAAVAVVVCYSDVVFEMRKRHKGEQNCVCVCVRACVRVTGHLMLLIPHSEFISMLKSSNGRLTVHCTATSDGRSPYRVQ
jgi:hypothetical protein